MNYETLDPRTDIVQDRVLVEVVGPTLDDCEKSAEWGLKKMEKHINEKKRVPDRGRQRKAT